MVNSSTVRFYPSTSNPSDQDLQIPLARYLPPLPTGMVSSWLADHVPANAWLLDPLGTTPALALEAARAGYRIIVACNNPILRLITEVLAAAHGQGEFQAALSELTLARRGEERLDRHIQNLYQTTCNRCGEIIPAQAYLWRKGEDKPFARLARCNKCGEEGENPVNTFDLERLNLLGNDALHRSRAIQRVVMSDDEKRDDVEQALASYLPRPLYILFTLINKSEGLKIPPERLKLLQALLITAFDSGNTLWPWPSGRTHPRQLIVPTQYRENNLWAALEEAAIEWAAHSNCLPVPVTHWPDLPPLQGGVCLFHGRIKSLMPLPPEINPQAIITVFPRPNQAFWTLSVLWSGWLWGREAALPLRNVLDRRRFDWNWHTTALHSALSALNRPYPIHAPFFGLLPDLAPGFLTATLTAARAAGLHLQGLALQTEEAIAQGVWSSTSISENTMDHEIPVELDPNRLETMVRSAMRNALIERAEPAPYLTVYSAGITALAQSNAIQESSQGISGDIFTRLQTTLTRPFSDRSFLKFYPANTERQGNTVESSEDERGWWWLAEKTPVSVRTPDTANLPLSDRVEMQVIRLLHKQPFCTLDEVNQAISRLFPGLLSPSKELIRFCLESYAEIDPSNPTAWRLRSGESPSERREDLSTMRSILHQMGEKLGYKQINVGETSLTWQPTHTAPGWVFYLMASSIISRFILAPQPEELSQNELPVQHLLVVPGGRSRLLTYKIRRDPRLAELLKDWRILKFRHLRQLAVQFSERTELSQTEWLANLDLDPLTEEVTQIPLF